MKITKAEALKNLIAENADLISIPNGFGLQVISVQNAFELIDEVFTDGKEGVNIGENFRDFIHTQDGYDPREVAALCYEILTANGVKNISTPHSTGIILFDEGE